MKSRRRAQQGALLIAAVVIIVVFGFIAASVTYISVVTSHTGHFHFASTRAFDLAESGEEYAIHNLTTKVADRMVCAGNIYEQQPFGERKGKFIISANSYAPSTILANAIDATYAGSIPTNNVEGFSSAGQIKIDGELIDYGLIKSNCLVGGVTYPFCFQNISRGAEGTTVRAHDVNATVDAVHQVGALADNIGATTSNNIIPVDTPISYAASGSIMIDKEVIDYASIASGSAACGGFSHCFVVVKRGAEGTVATSHAFGAPIGQYQCVVTSMGEMPSVSVSPVRRSVIEDVQLQRGWVVGLDDGRDETLLKWDTTKNWSLDSSFELNKVLYGIDMISYADGWAVGASGTVLQYKNNMWREYTNKSSNFRTASIRGISCLNSDDCWAVGYSGRIYHYPNPSASGQWYRFQDLPRDDGGLAYLRAVNCADADNCYAVGYYTSSDDGVIYKYSGNSADWTKETIDGYKTNDWFYGVYCIDKDNCWAVAQKQTKDDEGVLYHYDPSKNPTWYKCSVKGKTACYTKLSVKFGPLNAVYCTSADDCWFVGNASVDFDNYNFYHYNGTSIDKAERISANGGNYYDINAIACYSKNDCWAAGDRGYLYHYDGTSWSEYSRPVTRNLYDMSLVGPKRHPESIWREDV